MIQESVVRVFHGEKVMLQELRQLSTRLGVARSLAKRILNRPITLREFLLECVSLRAFSMSDLVLIGVAFHFDSDDVRVELLEMANEHVVVKRDDLWYLPTT